jgi:hypothetical protein
VNSPIDADRNPDNEYRDVERVDAEPPMQPKQPKVTCFLEAQGNYKSGDNKESHYTGFAELEPVRYKACQFTIDWRP